MEHISKNQIKQIRSLQQKKFRDEQHLFVAEGEKCISELSKAFHLRLLVNESNATPIEIAQMSSLRTPQGSIAVFEQRNENEQQNQLEDLTLALDEVQDPGNLGTIIRTADWFGIRHIYCSLNTADCYNPKVVQATMGALARVHIHYVNLPDWLQSAQTKKADVIGTLLFGNDMYEEMKKKRNLCAPRIVIMGNEGNGISESVRSLITHPIRIPSYPPNTETSESLNVAIATAIVLAELRRDK